MKDNKEGFAGPVTRPFSIKEGNLYDYKTKI